MMKKYREILLAGVCVSALVANSWAAESKILTNHLGYETKGPKHAVVLGKAGDNISAVTGRRARTTIGAGANNGCPMRPGIFWRLRQAGARVASDFERDH